MKKVSFILLVIFALFSCKSNNPTLGIENGNGVTNPKKLNLSEKDKKILTYNNAFSLNLYRGMCKSNDNSNIVCSPFSASALLGMIMNGAEGETFNQIRNSLGFEEFDRDGINSYYEKLFEALPALDKTNIFRIANSAWIGENTLVEETFISDCSHFFNATIENVDFRKEETSIDIINKWAKTNTGNNIKSVVDHSMINANTEMVLVNALFFSGKWASVFDKKNTSKNVFNSVVGKQTVDMMEQAGDFKYYGDENLQILEMDYKENKYCMDIILPDEKSSLEIVTEYISKQENWNTLLQQMETLPVTVTMPKFDLQYSVELSAMLKRIGIEDVFNKSANLSKISKENLLVNGIGQTSRIIVNETGTEASSATSGTVDSELQSFAKYIFTADHPFMIIIREKEYGVILFMAQINQI
ncbi:MAG: serpin family protein [Paludibacteraceae bacterium]|nr:serpin family protein [Paludibacteraceae bacterium]